MVEFAARILRKLASIGHNIEMRGQRAKALVAPSTRLLAGCNLNTETRSNIVIDEFCTIAATIQSFENGRIHIGSHTFIGPNTRIWAHDAIHIGDRCLIAHDVNIIDSNSHSLSARQRHLEYCSTLKPGAKRLPTDVARKPITIGNDVWIGHSSILLKGVTLGDGCVVGAGTLVTQDVPPFTIVVGNPMRVIGQSEA